jgi:hypothetical protein
MHPTRLGVPVVVRASLAVAAGLALVLGAGVQPAAATSSVPPPVALGVHRFGHLPPPDAIVARAGPDEVGFSSPPKGADGISIGPWSFDVAQDGSVWLLDEVNHQLLVWQAGQPDGPARSVPLPMDPLERIANFTVAPDHTIYATYVAPSGPKTLRLAALTPSGQVRWTAATTDEIFNAQLRIGPDNALYLFGGHSGRQDWTPLTTPAGRPLPLAEQRRRTSLQQPLPGGLRLAATYQAMGPCAAGGSPARPTSAPCAARQPWSAATRSSCLKSPSRPSPGACTSTRSCGWLVPVGQACGSRSPPSRAWSTAKPT